MEVSGLPPLLYQLLHLQILDIDQPLELIDFLLQACRKVRVVLLYQVQLALVNSLELGLQAIEFELPQPLHLNQLLLQHFVLRAKQAIAIVQVLLQLLLLYQQRLDLLVLGAQAILESHILELDSLEVGQVGLLDGFDLRQVIGFQLVANRLGLPLPVDFVQGQFASEPFLLLPKLDDLVLALAVGSVDAVFAFFDLVLLPFEQVLELSDFQLVHLRVPEMLPLKVLQLHVQLAARLVDLSCFQVLQLCDFQPKPFVFPEEFLDLEVLVAAEASSL